jgi:hypothetical protein
MTRNTVASVLAFAALGLTACDEHEHMVNTGICADFKTTQAAAPGMNDAAAPVDDCLRRWAYSLAGARDPADVVAQAAVAACGPALGRWSQATLNQQVPAGGEGLSLTTGQPTNPLAEHSAFANGRALLYVVQARAGRCAPPPTTNGVPAGT